MCDGGGGRAGARKAVVVERREEEREEKIGTRAATGRGTFSAHSSTRGKKKEFVRLSTSSSASLLSHPATPLSRTPSAIRIDFRT